MTLEEFNQPGHLVLLDAFPQQHLAPQRFLRRPMPENGILRQIARNQVAHQLRVSLPVHAALEIVDLDAESRQILFPGEHVQRHRMHQHSIDIEDKGQPLRSVIHAGRIARKTFRLLRHPSAARNRCEGPFAVALLKLHRAPVSAQAAAGIAHRKQPARVLPVECHP